MEKEILKNESRQKTKETPMTGIFVGFPINAEIAHDLGKNSAWKEAIITRHERPQEIQEIIFQDKKYIGRYILKKKISMEEIEVEETLIRTRLCDFIPIQKTEILKLQIIAQLFLY